MIVQFLFWLKSTFLIQMEKQCIVVSAFWTYTIEKEMFWTFIVGVKSYAH